MRLYLSLFYFILSLQVFASQGVDSLLNLLDNERDDSVRVSLYLQMGDLAEANDDKLSYYQQALALSRKDDHRYYTYQPFFKIAVLKTDMREKDSVACYYDRALYYANMTSDTLGLAKVYHSYGVYMRFLANPDSTLEYTRKARNLYLALRDSFRYYRLLNNEAVMNKSRGQLELAKKQYNEIIGNADHPRDSWAIAAANLGMAVISKNTGDYENAIAQNLEAYRVWKDLNDTTFYCKALNNLALMYVSVSMPSLALDLFNEIIETKPRKDVYAEPLALANIASIYANRENYVKANHYADLAIAGMDTIGNLYYQTVFQLIKAEVLMREKKYDDAKPYILEALAKAEKHKFSHDYSTALILYADLLYAKENYEAAIKNAKRAMLNAEENKHLEYLLKSNYILGKSLFQLKQNNDAAPFLIKALELNDSIKKEEENADLKEVALTYELGKREAVNESLRKEAHLNKTIIDKTNHILRLQRLYLVIALVFLVFALVFLWVLHRNNQIKKRLNDNLYKLNQEMDAKNAELQDLLAVNGKIFSIISHDLKSPLIAMHNSILLLKNEKMTKESKQKVLSLAEGQIDSTLDLFENLLRWAKTHQDGIKINKSVFAVCDIIKENVDLHSVPLHNKGLTIETNCSLEYKIESDPDILKLIIRNLLSNAIKFTPRNGVIKVEVVLEKNELIIRVSDTGIGITREQIDSIFHKDEFNTKNGTENEKGSGLGLKICVSFINQLGGELIISGEPNAGSVFAIKLPVGLI